MPNIFTFVSAPDETRPLHLLLAGITAPDAAKFISRGSENRIWVFQYILSGRGFLREEELPETECVAGDVVITHAGKRHSYYPDPDNPWGKVWVNVSGAFPGTLLSGFGLAETCVFRRRPEAGKMLEKAVRSLSRLPAEKADDFIAGTLLRMVCMLEHANGEKDSGNGKSRSAAERLRMYLDGFIQSPPPTLEKMARQMNLSPSQTIRCFRRRFGITPYAYLLDAKIRAAREVLRNSSEPVRDTAQRFGFANEYYFSRLFREKAGMPPGRFRDSDADEK